MRQGLHQTQNQNSWSWNKGRAFFPLLSIEKIYFPAAVLPDPLQLARSWTAALKKRTVETSLILLLCFFPSVCLLTAILMVGVLLQLRGLRSRIGLCGPSTAFLLHPFHCRLHLCRWQTPTVGFMWAGAFQRCLRCLTSSFSRQLSMPDTLLPSLVANTLKLLSWGMGREGSVGQICPPQPCSPGLRGQKISWTVQSQWVGSGRHEHEGFGAVCATRGTFSSQETILHGQRCGEVKPPFTCLDCQPSSLACLSETQGWSLRLQLVQYLCSWSGKRHGFYSLLGGWVPLGCPSPVAPESSVAA